MFHRVLIGSETVDEQFFSTMHFQKKTMQKAFGGSGKIFKVRIVLHRCLRDIGGRYGSSDGIGRSNVFFGKC